MKDKLINLLLPITWILILIFCCFIFAFSSNASSTADGSLPYKKSQILTYNSFMSNDIIDKLRTLNLPVDDNKYVLMYSDHSPYTQYPQYNNQYDVSYYFFLLPIESFNSVYDGYNFYNNNLGVSLTPNSYYYYISVTCDLTSNFELIAIRTPSYTSYSTSLYQSGMFGHIPSVDSVSGFTFTPFTPVYFNQDFYSINDVLVLDYVEQSFVHTDGHATPPDPFDDPVVPSGHTLPHQVPTLTINNYTWTTAPTPDLTTLENSVKSIFYILQWISNNLVGEFSNLISNLYAIGQYIGETIQYYGGLIISNIQNSITTLYNNFVSLFEPISNAVSYISQPVSGTVIYDNISGTTLIQSINTVDTALTTFQGTFTGLSEPNSFVIPIHLESLPSSLFGTQTTQYLDLSWINSDMRTLIRGFMWAIITYSLFITIVDSISNYINGGGDES